MHRISTRKVDDLVKALGAASGISKSEVSRICAELDRDLDAFRARPLDHIGFPYVFIDATYLKGRVRGRVVSRAVVIATGVTATGDREVLGIDVGDSEDDAFWTAFLRGLRARGLGGVQLVISDHHLGLKTAIGAVFIGAGWQRCRVHFMRNVLARVPKASAEMVAAAIRTIFAQPDADHVRTQLDEVARMLEGQYPEVATMLRDATEDLLAFSGFPVAHWRKLWSTNPLERITYLISQWFGEADYQVHSVPRSMARVSLLCSSRWGPGCSTTASRWRCLVIARLCSVRARRSACPAGWAMWSVALPWVATTSCPASSVRVPTRSCSSPARVRDRAAWTHGRPDPGPAVERHLSDPGRPLRRWRLVRLADVPGGVDASLR